MTLNEYQQACERTANRQTEDKEKAIMVSLIGLAEECGEVLGILKKVYGHSHELKSEHLKKELGDVLWYLSDVCSKFGFSLEEVAALNVDKLNKRYPTGFSSELSKNRSPDDK